MDLPWRGVCAMIGLAREFSGDDSVLARINNSLAASKIDKINDLTLLAGLDSEAFRRALGVAAKNGDWFKEVGRGERLAAIVGPLLDEIAEKPLVKALLKMRTWVDA
jgi:hypothetical protein